MTEALDGEPVVGSGGRLLGVRLGNSATPDVHAVLAADIVTSGGGGMSVAPGDSRYLPKHRRPPSLGGTGTDPVWYIEMDDLGTDLLLSRDSPTHAVIEPARPMTLAEYQQALESTRARWQLFSR